MERTHKPRRAKPHHPELSPVGTTVTYRMPNLPKHYTTCGTYYGGSFLDHIGPSTAQYNCTCSKHKPHVCCLSLTEYMSPSTHQPTHAPKPDCRTKLFIRKFAGEAGQYRIQNVDVLEPLPPVEASAEASQNTSQKANQNASHKAEPGNADEFEIAGVPVVKHGADVNVAADDQSANADDNMDDVPDMEPIPLSDPVDEIIDNEYNVVSEFPEEEAGSDSDEDFDVPSPSNNSSSNSNQATGLTGADMEEPAQATSVWSTIASYASSYANSFSRNRYFP